MSKCSKSLYLMAPSAQGIPYRVPNGTTFCEIARVATLPNITLWLARNTCL